MTKNELIELYRGADAKHSRAHDALIRARTRHLRGRATDAEFFAVREAEREAERDLTEAEHMIICHSDGTECENGCEKVPLSDGYEIICEARGEVDP